MRQAIYIFFSTEGLLQYLVKGDFGGQRDEMNFCKKTFTALREAMKLAIIGLTITIQKVFIIQANRFFFK